MTNEDVLKKLTNYMVSGVLRAACWKLELTVLICISQTFCGFLCCTVKWHACLALAGSQQSETTDCCHLLYMQFTMEWRWRFLSCHSSVHSNCHWSSCRLSKEGQLKSSCIPPHFLEVRWESWQLCLDGHWNQSWRALARMYSYCNTRIVIVRCPTCASGGDQCTLAYCSCPAVDMSWPWLP